MWSKSVGFLLLVVVYSQRFRRHLFKLVTERKCKTKYSNTNYVGLSSSKLSLRAKNIRFELGTSLPESCSLVPSERVFFFFVSFVFYIICRSIGFFAFANLIFVCGYSFINTRQTANVWHEIGMRFKKLLRFGPRKLMTKMSLSLQSFVLLLLLSVPNHLTFY